ncbi:hypothetical protein DPMN_178081 [Dreissena polymorpha]|uniref:Uncharacterized protein n=1 Tax=Dreissena polymorpha TaxID=45954 RepID=A0A9D4EC73_DREPO|nr:hypothetical protein DPMN_178081 [Dreissena polymorpha]
MKQKTWSLQYTQQLHLWLNEHSLKTKNSSKHVTMSLPCIFQHTGQDTQPLVAKVTVPEIEANQSGVMIEGRLHHHQVRVCDRVAVETETYVILHYYDTLSLVAKMTIPVVNKN